MSLPQKSKKTTSAGQTDLGELHHMEVELIKAIRERFRYGELVITARDGLPFQILRYVEIERFQGK